MGLSDLVAGPRVARTWNVASEVAVKELKSSYHKSETILVAIYPYSSSLT